MAPPFCLYPEAAHKRARLEILNRSGKAAVAVATSRPRMSDSRLAVPFGEQIVDVLHKLSGTNIRGAPAFCYQRKISGVAVA